MLFYPALRQAVDFSRWIAFVVAIHSMKRLHHL